LLLVNFILRQLLLKIVLRHITKYIFIASIILANIILAKLAFAEAVSQNNIANTTIAKLPIPANNSNPDAKNQETAIKANVANVSDQIKSSDKASEVESTNIYAVDGIEAKATAKSLATAKALAFDNARKDAFLVLLSRLEIDSEIINNISAEEISSMVRSERVLKEKLSSNSYSANFNIVFAKSFVDHILAKKQQPTKPNENTQPNEEQKPNPEYMPVPQQVNNGISIVVPVYIDNNKPVIEANIWQQSLEKAFGGNFVAIGNQYNNIVNPQNINNITYDNIKNILDDKKAQSMYIVFFTHNQVENKAIIDITNITSWQQKQMRLSFANVDLVNKNNLIPNIASKTMQYLKNKAQTQPPAKNIYNLQLAITSYQQWLNYRSTLENSGSIAKIIINSISFDRITVDVEYTGKVPFEDFLNTISMPFKKVDNTYKINQHEYKR